MSQIASFAVDVTFAPGNWAFTNSVRNCPQLSSGALMQEGDARHPGGIVALGFAALGVVFGDIGTSPLYTLKTVLDLPDRVDADCDHQH
jgi:hypothetical protein